MNKTLSQQRAAAVKAWLVLHKVDAKRLDSEGFGPDRPIDDNATDAGRRNNRRVEFHIGDKEATTPSAAPAAVQPAPAKPAKPAKPAGGQPAKNP